MTRRILVSIAIAVLFAIQTLISVSIFAGAPGISVPIEEPECSILEERGGLPGQLSCKLGKLNENGLIEDLIFNFMLDDSAPGDYTLFVTLSPEEGDTGSNSLRQIAELGSGEQQVIFRFSGPDIHRLKLNMPMLFEIIFIDSRSLVTGSLYAVDGYQTYTNFESGKDAGFIDNVDVFGRDTNENGRANELVIQFNVFTQNPGDYTVIGELSPVRQRYLSDDLVYAELYKEALDNEKKEEEPEINLDGGTRSNEADADLGASAEGSGSREADTGLNDENSGSMVVTIDDSDPGTSAGKVRYGPTVEIHPVEGVTAVQTVSFHTDSLEREETKIRLVYTGKDVNSLTWAGQYVLTANIYQETTHIDDIEWKIDTSSLDFDPLEPHATFTNWFDFKPVRDGSILTMEVDVSADDPESFHVTAEAFPKEPTASDDTSGEKDQGNPKVEHTVELDGGEHELEFFFQDEQFLHGAQILVGITTRATGGSDFKEISISPFPGTDPDPDDGPVRIRDAQIKDRGKNTDGDKEFEHLLVEITALIPTGHYSYDAKLYSSDKSYQYGISSLTGEFKVGTIDDGTTAGDVSVEKEKATLSMHFPGEDIFLSGIHGPYAILVYLTAENGTVYFIEGKTADYKFTQFSPASGREEDGPEPEFLLTNSSLFLHTDVFASEVHKDSPELVFYYYTDMGESVKFRVRYTRLVAFNDDGDGIYEEGEEAYQAYLNTRNWQMGPVSHGIDQKLGSHLTFNMSTTITMEPVGGDTGAINIRDWGRLTLHFLIANNTVNETEFKIRGGEELKITVEITPYKVLPVNAVALEQTIIQSYEGNIVDSDYSNGQLAVVWEPDDVGVNCDPNRIPSLRFEDDDGDGTPRVMGYYSWACTAEETMINGSSSTVLVGSSAHSENGSVTLFLAYPLSINVGNIEHDPSVGVVRENAPAMLIKTITEETGDPAFYLLGIVLAVTVVFVTLGQGGRKRKTPMKGKGNGSSDHSKMEGGHRGGSNTNVANGPGTDASFMNHAENGSGNGNGSINGNGMINGTGRINGSGMPLGNGMSNGNPTDMVNGIPVRNGEGAGQNGYLYDSFAPKEKA